MHRLLGKFRKFPGGGPPDPPIGVPQARVAHSRAEVPSILAWPPLLRFCGSAPGGGGGRLCQKVEYHAAEGLNIEAVSGFAVRCVINLFAAELNFLEFAYSWIHQDLID